MGRVARRSVSMSILVIGVAEAVGIAVVWSGIGFLLAEMVLITLELSINEIEGIVARQSQSKETHLHSTKLPNYLRGGNF